MRNPVSSAPTNHPAAAATSITGLDALGTMVTATETGIGMTRSHSSSCMTPVTMMTLELGTQARPNSPRPIGGAWVRFHPRARGRRGAPVGPAGCRSADRGRILKRRPSSW